MRVIYIVKELKRRGGEKEKKAKGEMEDKIELDRRQSTEAMVAVFAIRNLLHDHWEIESQSHQQCI